MAKTIKEFVFAPGYNHAETFRKLVGRNIYPPTTEAHLYGRDKYRIIAIKADGKPSVSLDFPIQKRETAKGSFYVVCKTKFFISDDPDSIWRKFTIGESTTSSTSDMSSTEIVALNNVRAREGNNTCVSCGKPLTPLFGTMYGCLECEK